MSGGRPPKPIQLVKGHRTKAEKEIRLSGESQLLTGIPLDEFDEVKNNEIAHKEFLRIKKLLESIGKDDDLSGHIINTHCLLVAECKELEQTKRIFELNLEKFEDRLSGEDISFTEEMKIRISMQKQILDCDKVLMGKRKMLLDIGKENILTIASALRSVAKKPEEKKKSKMAEFLSKGKAE